MSIEVNKFNSNLHAHLAEQICAAQAHGSDQMLPLTMDTMAGHLLGVIASIGDVAVGYNAVTAEFSGDTPTIEIGGLYVVREHRTVFRVVAGLKHKLHGLIPDAFPGQPALVFCNPKSLALNIRLGAVGLNMSEVPTQALDLCKGCPKQCSVVAPQICCDTILGYSAETLRELAGMTFEEINLMTETGSQRAKRLGWQR